MENLKIVSLKKKKKQKKHPVSGVSTLLVGLNNGGEYIEFESKGKSYFLSYKTLLNEDRCTLTYMHMLICI